MKRLIDKWRDIQQLDNEPNDHEAPFIQDFSSVTISQLID